MPYGICLCRSTEEYCKMTFRTVTVDRFGRQKHPDQARIALHPLPYLKTTNLVNARDCDACLASFTQRGL